MKNQFIKTYIYLLIIVAFINIIFGTINSFSPNMIILLFMYLATIIEIPLIILSIIMLFYVPSKKLNKIHLILPIFYLIVYIGLAFYGGFMAFNGINPLDLSYSPNIIAFIISEVFYLFQMGFGIFLLKKKHKKQKNPNK